MKNWLTGILLKIVMNKKALKILIVIEEGPQFYYYKNLVQILCERGHRVKILFAKREDLIFPELQTEFLNKFPNLAWGKSFYRSPFWKLVLRNSRPILNYRRFLMAQNYPAFYAERLEKFLPIWLRPLVRWRFLNIKFVIKASWVKKLLHLIEAGTPIDSRILNQILADRPDVMLIAAGNNLVTTSPDYDYVKAAKKLGIAHAFSVFSWDYLETKGVVHSEPDWLWVWNEVLKKEAVGALDFPAEKIVIVGAAQFDSWFARLNKPPSKNRRDFCRTYKLDAGRPIIAYLGSAGVFGNETGFFEEIYAALKKEPALAKVQFIIRPHPKNSKSFADFKRAAVAVVPEAGQLATSQSAMQLFYDTLYHAAAVIGIGTSGFIDALVADKPAVTLIADYYDHLQAHAPHFRHLLENGVLETARRPEELPAITANILAGGDRCRQQRREFIKKFIRPRGLTEPVSEIMARELENLAAKKISRHA